MIKKTGKSGQHLGFSEGQPDVSKKTGEKVEGAAGLKFQDIKPKEPAPAQTQTK